MIVQELIASYANEELGIKICDNNTDQWIIPHIWRTDWMLVCEETKVYVYKSFHQYDNKEVSAWEMINNELFIYI